MIRYLLLSLALAGCTPDPADGTTTPLYTPDLDGDGVADADDCGPDDATVFPGAVEVCDGKDDDCDGEVDEDGTAVAWHPDADQDGYGDPNESLVACAQPEGYVLDGADCDDDLAAVHPFAIEACDGIDEDCDGDVDETAGTLWYADADGDGFGDPDVVVSSCEQPAGYVGNHDDCDDADAALAPGPLWHRDADGDGYGDPDATLYACSQPPGYTADDQDCDDTIAFVNPSEAERCDSVDDDCDGEVDEPDATDASTWYDDADGDGFGDAETATIACDPTAIEVEDGTDCDDGDDTVHPGADELAADGVDQDCDGGDACYADTDADGYGTSSTVASADLDCDDAGESSTPDDCDDATSDVHPGATEIAGDQVDEDCDGGEVCWADTDGDGYGGAALTSADSDCVDAGETAVGGDCDDADATLNPDTVWYADGDGDGYGDPATSAVQCSAPSSYVRDATDCDDGASTVHPGAAEVTADGVDQDCDGGDECYSDEDGDGYAGEGTVASADLDCKDAGEGSSITDCDDTSAVDHPGATEYVANGEDEDCDGGDACYADADHDGYGGTTTVASSDLDCSGLGESANDDDADDGNPAVYPGAPELVADGVDEDQDGTELCYADLDGDGYGSTSTTSSADLDCSDTGESLWSTDCDDALSAAHPGATETCDLVDDDCDGSVDEGVTTTWYADDDGDTYGDDAASYTGCAQPTGYVAEAGDCDDGDATVSPAAVDDCDGVDEDCDGKVDGGFNVPASYPTVAAAIAAAPSGATICVAAGTHAANLTTGATTLTLEGYEGADVTTLDGGGTGRVLKASSSALTLRGLTLTGGYADYGAAIYASGGTYTLEDVVIEGNDATAEEGGASFTSATVTMTDVDILDNTATSTNAYGVALRVQSSTLTADRLFVAGNAAFATSQCGGALMFTAGTSTLTNLVVAGNSCTDTDGALYDFSPALFTGSSAKVTVTNGSIVGNTSDPGSDRTGGTALFVYHSTDVVTLKNVLIADNVATSGTTTAAIYTTGASPTISYTDFWANDGSVAYGFTSPVGSSGNVSLDPELTAFAGTDWTAWDLTLSSSSPLVDAGSPSILDADGTTSDIGAYGGPGAAGW